MLEIMYALLKDEVQHIGELLALHGYDVPKLTLLARNTNLEEPLVLLISNEETDDYLALIQMLLSHKDKMQRTDDSSLVVEEDDYFGILPSEE